MSKKKATKVVEKVVKPTVGKYVFPNEEQGRKLLECVSKDNLIAVLGNRTSGFLVDILWTNGECCEEWAEYRIELETEGIHKFRDYSYLKNKI
ncbi:MAG: hypothetical protein H8E55_51705 [Pelagibacterales bacterium]|nr:hypothetical protein [Pelagibacterales bacterium]